MNNIIGQRIKLLREKKGYSQANLAQILSISPQAVGKWERGESLPDIFMLADIGLHLGNTDLCYFVGKDFCHCTCGCCECCGAI
ncbi:MAG: helix-turn-helix transcriptional regulator [Firmicutes bacterium]|nr:helix-turn-helix transcriptional regulator [Bacillota bacterium]